MLKALVVSGSLLLAAVACSSANESKTKSEGSFDPSLYALKVVMLPGVAGSTLGQDSLTVNCKDGTNETYSQDNVSVLDNKLADSTLCSLMVPQQNFVEICNQSSLQDDSYQSIVSEVFGRQASMLDCANKWKILKRKTSLSLYELDLTSIKALGGLNGLVELDLESNKIEDLSGVESLLNLEVISLKGNALKDVSKLTKLLKLREVNLEDNSELTDVSALYALPQLIKVSVRGTGLPADFDFAKARAAAVPAL